VQRAAARVADSRRALIPLAYGIGGVASYWFIERIAAF
jgi:hypothetical protein